MSKQADAGQSNARQWTRDEVINALDILGAWADEAGLSGLALHLEGLAEDYAGGGLDLRPDDNAIADVEEAIEAAADALVRVRVPS